MENTSTDVMFKAEHLEAIGFDIKNAPTLPEAIQAEKTANIVREQPLDLFLSKSVEWVFNALDRKPTENKEFWAVIDAFNLGYIMGIRKERAKKKGGKI